MRLSDRRAPLTAMLEQIRAHMGSRATYKAPRNVFSGFEQGGVKGGLPEVANAAQARIRSGGVAAVDALEGPRLILIFGFETVPLLGTHSPGYRS
jgi:hypothetical protein